MAKKLRERERKQMIGRKYKSARNIKIEEKSQKKKGTRLPLSARQKVERVEERRHDGDFLQGAAPSPSLGPGPALPA